MLQMIINHYSVEKLLLWNIGQEIYQKKFFETQSKSVQDIIRGTSCFHRN